MAGRTPEALIEHQYGVKKVSDCAAGALCKVGEPILEGDRTYRIPVGIGEYHRVHRECFVAYAVEEFGAIDEDAELPAPT